jgi:hypothetical protein
MLRILCAMPSYAGSRSYRVYEEHVSGSFRIIELASLRRARRLVKTGDVREAAEQDGETPCFVMVKVVGGTPQAALGMRVVNPKDMEIDRSSTAFTIPEMNALAGTKFRHGRSLTARMSEENRAKRKDRRGRQLPVEDLVEKATNKKTEWGLSGPALQELVREVEVGWLRRVI